MVKRLVCLALTLLIVLGASSCGKPGNAEPQVPEGWTEACDFTLPEEFELTESENDQFVYNAPGIEQASILFISSSNKTVFSSYSTREAFEGHLKENFPTFSDIKLEQYEQVKISGFDAVKAVSTAKNGGLPIWMMEVAVCARDKIYLVGFAFVDIGTTDWSSTFMDCAETISITYENK